MPAADPSKTPLYRRWFIPKLWRFPAGILGIAVLFSAFAAPARLAFRYDRDALAAGEWWRLASGHFVHLGWQHMALNAAGLLLVWFLAGERLALRQWLIITVFIIAGIDIGFWWLSPGLTWYVGLSGLLHGLLFAGVIAGIRSTPVESVLLLLIVGGKLVFEQFSGPLPGSEAASGGPVVVDAHLYGSIAGLIAAMPFVPISRRPPTI